MAYSLAEKLYANKPYSEPASDVLGLKVEFRVPSAAEEDEIARAVSGQSESFVAMLQLRKIPTLARAVRSIDGVEFKDFEEVKQRLHSNKDLTLAHAVEAELRGTEYTEEVITSLYMAYADFRQRHRDALASLKKTSAQLNPVTAG
jgi:hypothetical protein